MNKNNNLLAVLAVGLLAGPMAAQAQADYDFEQIDYPGAPSTSVFGINDRGDVVGHGRINPDQFPFVYESRTGTFTDVAPLAGYARTSVFGITDSGVMVGSVLSLEFSTRSGFIRGKDGTYAVFSHPEAPFFTEARAVNNNGLVSGIRNTSTGLPVGFIYDPETDTFTDIVPSILTIAHGINSKGAVVGDARFFNADDPCPGSIDPIVRVGWLRAADGSISYFQVNGLPTAARGINDVGSIVGFVIGPVESKGFVVKLDGSPCQSLTVADNDFLEFPGFNHLIPEGITNSGVIVGIVRDEFSVGHGFIATRR